jgi:hypothetical protein
VIPQSSNFIIYAVHERSLVRVGQGYRDGAYMLKLENREWRTFRRYAFLSSVPLHEHPQLAGMPKDLDEFEIMGKPEGADVGRGVLAFKGASLRDGLVLLVLNVPAERIATLGEKLMGFQRADVELQPCPVPDCPSKHSVTTPLCSRHWMLLPRKECNEYWELGVEQKPAYLEKLWRKHCLIEAPKPGGTVTLPGGSTIVMPPVEPQKKKPRAIT